ncbi:peptide chain release factor N(5)-glutamine methyltransferase [Azonexus sp.]|uniref:peptide chain release factor N(5)-glutamine methyltransferase n=1 Tax=Azonexus sp. TaxID=1872668 RepID=UPI0039E2DB82
MTLGEALLWARAYVDRLDARLLIQSASGCSHSDLLARPEIPLIAPAQAQFMEWVQRRAAGEPLAYLLGEAEFRGRLFQVSPAVLVPRPETELLIELALEKSAALRRSAQILDLGTGSGIVAISLALESPGSVVSAVDLSSAALDVARNNAGRLKASVALVQGDWYAPLAGRRFDLIVANPPYIAADDPHLCGDGLPFEPPMALTDKADGLACIRQIVAGAGAHLMPGGWLLFEHGYDQGLACRNLLQAAGFQDVFTHPDLAGTDRVSGGKL